MALSALLGCAPLAERGTGVAAIALAPPPASFRVEGRVSVRAAGESFSGGMIWQHARDKEELLLRTPLGQGVAELRGGPEGMRLEDAKGRIHRAGNADELVRQALGMELPLRGLTWWIVGHPRPDVPYVATPDDAGRLRALEQDGWRIAFSRYASRGAHVVPGRLVASRGDELEVRLVVDQWELP